MIKQLPIESNCIMVYENNFCFSLDFTRVKIMLCFARLKILKLFYYLILITIVFCLFYSEILIIKTLDRNQQKPSFHNNIALLTQKLLENRELNEDLVDIAERESNIPLNYYNKWKGFTNSDDWKGKDIKTCDTELPTIGEIDFNNIFWQTIPNTNKTQYFLYNVFYDNRGDTKYVRVVGHWRPNNLETRLWSIFFVER